MPALGDRARRSAVAVALALGVLLAPAVARADTPKLDWRGCGDGFECATALVPLDYAKRDGREVELAVLRLPATDRARRIGSLFVNYGGPGGDGVETTRRVGKELFAPLNDRFDIVAFDPRGVGASRPALDCDVNQEAEGAYAQPFVTPENIESIPWVDRAQRYVSRCVDRNAGILPYVSAANVARDMDLLRSAVGDRELSYLGFSYGTYLGATYASLFPDRVGSLVLDGALDADGYANRPLQSLREQSAGFERALGRFLQACATTKDVCPFGGADPWQAFDELVERAEAEPLPAPNATNPSPVDGDDLRAGATLAVHQKQLWPVLAGALTAADAGDATVVRELVDAFYGRLPDGGYDAVGDRYFLIGAIEQRYPRDIETYRDAGRHSWGLFDHAWWNSGYVELPWALMPVEPRGAYHGPFRSPAQARTTLVIGTTYDPATPYRGSRRLVADLGNARLLTMRGDGHTAFGGNSPCVDAAVEGYLEDGRLPVRGAVCRQEVPFALPRPLSTRAAKKALRDLQPHVSPVGVPR